MLLFTLVGAELGKCRTASYTAATTVFLSLSVCIFQMPCKWQSTYLCNLPLWCIYNWAAAQLLRVNVTHKNRSSLRFMGSINSSLFPLKFLLCIMFCITESKFLSLFVLFIGKATTSLEVISGWTLEDLSINVSITGLGIAKRLIRTHLSTNTSLVYSSSTNSLSGQLWERAYVDVYGIRWRILKGEFI